MSSPYISHEEATIAAFRKDPLYAAEYLNAVLEDGDEAELALALRRLASAFGKDGAAQLAQSNALYRTLSPTGNPQLRGLQAMLGALGMRLAVTPLAQR